MKESGHFIAITFILIASLGYSQTGPAAATPAAKANPFLERKPSSSKPGLRVLEYPRHDSQGNEENLYVPLEQLGKPVGRSYTVKSVHPWKWNGERNAVASGFLKIDVDGEYSFSSTSFYDRNMLMLDGKIVCKFRDGEETVATIPLKKGFVPFVSVGYVGARGTTEGIKLKWKPPGQLECRKTFGGVSVAAPTCARARCRADSAFDYLAVADATSTALRMTAQTARPT